MAFAVSVTGLRYSTDPATGVKVTTAPDLLVVNFAEISPLPSYKRAEVAPVPIVTATLPSVRAVRVGASAGGLLSKVYERAFEATDSLPAVSAPFRVKLVAVLYSTSPVLGVNVALRLPVAPENTTLKRALTSVDPANNFAVTTSSATLASMTPVAGVAATIVGVPGCAGAMVSRVSVTGVLVADAAFPAASSRVTPTVIVP